MSRQFFRVAILLLIIGLLAAVALPAPPAPPRPEDDTIHYLNQTIDWYRRVNSAGQSSVSSQDMLFRESVRKEARIAVALGFKFARVEADLLDLQGPKPATTSPSDDRARRLADKLASTRRRITDLETRLETLDTQLNAGAAATRPALGEERATVVSQLNFTRALRDTLSDFSDFTTRARGSSEAGVTRQVEDLARSVPEVEGEDTAATQPTAPAVATGQGFRPESAGIVRLTTELFSLSQRMADLSSLGRQTAALSKANDALRAPIRAELTAAVSRADALAATQPTSAQQQELDVLAARFRALSAAAVPLAGQKLLLDRTEASLSEWRSSLATEYESIVRHLLLRLGVMGGVILIVLGISALWRRATFKYVSDIRRQRQFLFLRRIIVGLAVTLVLVAGFVAEFGSLATFAGIITAGIAVAMQTVILSAVAYFFYIGRYGVRVGDRVTVGGVTGDVVDIGLFRLYLMELGGTHLKQKPTGRVAVFSNSVLFAATGFFRQVPGAEYGWHEVALTLAPTGNYKLAEDRLMTAVESVYGQYREDLERQHAAAARSFHVAVPDPKPEGRLRFVDAGLEFVVRYPVELRTAVETDDRVTRALLDAIEHEPTLKLVMPGTPTVQPAS